MPLGSPDCPTAPSVAVESRERQTNQTDDIVKKVHLMLVDAFTTEPGEGNRAGVVLGAEDLTKEEMQAIAAFANVSETVFITEVDEDGLIVESWYFTPTDQVQICGHATIAGFTALGETLLTGHLDDHEITVQTSTERPDWKLGQIKVSLSTTEQDKVKTLMTQGPPEFFEEIEGETKARLLAALGIDESDLIPDLPVQIVGTGHAKVLIPMKSYQQINDLNPNFEALAELSDELGPNGKGFFVFSLENDDEARYPTPDVAPPVRVFGRMFAPAIGINEDPVTGNANGPFGAYAVEHGLLQPDEDGIIRFTGRQGEAMRKAGLIEVRVRPAANAEPMQVQITGDAVIADRFDIVVSGSTVTRVTE